MNPLRIEPHQRRFAALVGVGGIGSGSFFALSGNHTLGREESRGGRFLDRRDYCKLHIIAHYTKALLGPEFAVFPIGRVGDDAPGRALRAEMEQAGLDLSVSKQLLVSRRCSPSASYAPDGSGGNLTTDDSACGRVTAATVAAAEPEFARYAGQGIALAVPKCRWRHGRHSSTTAPATASSALPPSRWRRCRPCSPAVCSPRSICLPSTAMKPRRWPARPQARSLFRQPSPRRWPGRQAFSPGCASRSPPAPQELGWDGQSLTHVPAFPAAVQSTAGAGDAHLSGILAGLTAGLPAAECQQLGALVAALAVTSPHTIHPGIDRSALAAFAAASSVRLSEAVRHLLAQ